MLDLRRLRLLRELSRRGTIAAVADLVAGEFDLIVDEEHPGFPLSRARETDRQALFTDELRLALPAAWPERPLASLAAALLPGLSGAAGRPGVYLQRLPGRPQRQIFTTVRRGSAAHPAIQAFTAALTAHRPGSPVSSDGP